MKTNLGVGRLNFTIPYFWNCFKNCIKNATLSPVRVACCVVIRPDHLWVICGSGGELSQTHKSPPAHTLIIISVPPPTLLPYHIPSQGLLPTTPQGCSWETSRESEDQITERVVCFSDRKEKAKCLGAFWTAVASLKVADKSLLKVVFLIVLTVMVLWSMCF